MSSNMPGNIIVMGESNKELFTESNIYDTIIENITSQLFSFIRYNPDDLSKAVIKKIVTRGFSNTPNKTIGPLHLKGEKIISIHLNH